MKNSLLLAVVALLLRAAAGAQIAEPRAASEVQAPAANLQFASLDKALDDLAFKLAELKNCVALHSALKANLAQKKRQFASENGGVVPFEFSEGVGMRIGTQQGVKTLGLRASEGLLERGGAALGQRTCRFKAA